MSLLEKENERLKKALKEIADLRSLNLNLKYSPTPSCAEDVFINFYCKMGDIAIKALSDEKFTQGEWEAEAPVNDDTPKPCPFCGGKAKISKDITGLTEVWCCDCLTSTGLHTPGDHAIKKWNTRPAEDEMYRVLSGICFEKSARICDYAPESCNVCSLNKALKKARGESV